MKLPIRAVSLYSLDMDATTNIQIDPNTTVWDTLVPVRELISPELLSLFDEPVDPHGETRPVIAIVKSLIPMADKGVHALATSERFIRIRSISRVGGIDVGIHNLTDQQSFRYVERS